MVLEQISETTRVNARQSDAFDLFNLQFYEGPNPYLPTGATVFDFAYTGNRKPLSLEEYLHLVGARYPQLQDQAYDSHAHLFICTLAEVSKLDMGLHLHQWSLQPRGRCQRLAVQSLHSRTSRAIAYTVWDWFEAITRDQRFSLDSQIAELQELFRQSVYGGPTVYALLHKASEMGIPSFYLWDEGLMQYGYGKNQVRGIATTFDSDSHLDSDFTTRKDDCKAFLNTLGFPVPRGEIVLTVDEALAAARRIGYPVAVKPVSGHKGIGVTAAIQDATELELAYDRAIAAIPPEQALRVIVESSISGKDFRLLCVNGRFVAATERRPASVTGDGDSTIAELIDRENRLPERSDTPTSPLGKIKRDGAMELYLQEQGLGLDSIVARGKTVYLRKVANLSAGGLSIDATATIHPDNIILAQDIAQHFRLTCLGIDVIAQDLGQSWKQGSLGIIEINAAPGIYMHLKPAIGDPVDVTAAILKTFFPSSPNARIPTITFNRLTVRDLQEIIDHILLSHPDWSIGGVCRDGVFINRSEKQLQPAYNTNVQNLLRNPHLDLLVAEYREAAFDREGLFYSGSNVVILDNPTEIEMTLADYVFEDSTVVIRQGELVSVRRQGLVEQYPLGQDEPFSRVYLKEIATVL